MASVVIATRSAVVCGPKVHSPNVPVGVCPTSASATTVMHRCAHRTLLATTRLPPIEDMAGRVRRYLGVLNILTGANGVYVGPTDPFLSAAPVTALHLVDDALGPGAMHGNPEITRTYQANNGNCTPIAVLKECSKIPSILSIDANSVRQTNDQYNQLS
jgi:hypothetical protein